MHFLTIIYGLLAALLGFLFERFRSIYSRIALVIFFIVICLMFSVQSQISQQKNNKNIIVGIEKTVKKEIAGYENLIINELKNLKIQNDNLYKKIQSNSSKTEKEINQSVRKLVIDPGHGGIDPGISTSNITESEANKLNTWGFWIQSFLTLIALMVALFGKEYVDRIKRPVLEVEFDINDPSFFHEIKFPLFEHGDHVHYSKGINCLLKISNIGRKKLFIQTEAAKEVEVKITYIHFGDKKYTFHPTNLNWSGGRDIRPIQITSGSHHFLDFFRFYNYDDSLWIDDSNSPEGIKKSAIIPDAAPIPLPKSRVYFEPWIIGDYKGIKSRFDNDGIYEICFVVYGANCGPYSYIAKMNWTKLGWDKPSIQISQV